MLGGITGPPSKTGIIVSFDHLLNTSGRTEERTLTVTKIDRGDGHGQVNAVKVLMPMLGKGLYVRLMRSPCSLSLFCPLILFVFYAFLVVSKESKLLVLHRTFY
jgi:hypothetical protein